MDNHNTVFDNIWVEESYFLGWEFQDNNLKLYLDLYLTSNHPLWDKNCGKGLFGCYKIGMLTIKNTQNVTGLNPGISKPKWNNALGEYTSLDEINTIQITGSSLTIEMDYRVLRVDFEQLNLKLFETSVFDF